MRSHLLFFRLLQATFVFQSPLNPGQHEINDHVALHGDGVKDVAFTVEDCRGIYTRAVERGAKSVRAPWEETDEFGTVVMATIQTVCDLCRGGGDCLSLCDCDRCPNRGVCSPVCDKCRNRGDFTSLEKDRFAG